MEKWSFRAQLFTRVPSGQRLQGLKSAVAAAAGHMGDALGPYQVLRADPLAGGKGQSPRKL